MTGSLAHCVIYTVLLSTLTAFDESTIIRGSAEMQVTGKCILENKHLDTLSIFELTA